jgi:hypothetical protein
MDHCLAVAVNLEHFGDLALVTPNCNQASRFDDRLADQGVILDHQLNEVVSRRQRLV